MTFPNKTLNIDAILSSIIVFLSINVFIKILPVSSEIQPLATIFVFLAILLRRKLTFSELIIYIIFIIFLIVSLFLTHDIPETLETFLAILSPIILYKHLINRVEFSNAVLKTIELSYYLWLTIAIVQYFYPNALYFTGMDFILNSLISRYSSEVIGGTGGRGVRILSPEPSYAAHVIFLYFSYWVCKFTYRFGSRGKSILNLFLVLCMAIFNRSTTIFFILTICVLFYFLILFFSSLYRSGRALHLLLLIFSLFILSYVIGFVDDGGRAHKIFSLILDSSNVSTAIKNIVVASGQRLTSVMVGYSVMFNFENLYYFGSWSKYFSHAATNLGFDIWSINYFSSIAENVKPYSIAATLSFEFGFLGLFLMLLVLYEKCLYFLYLPEFLIAIYFSCIFAIFFNSPVALPTYFIIIWILYIFSQEHNKCLSLDY